MPFAELSDGARLARHRLLHAADLLRFLRLLRHGDRPRADVRVPFSGEFPLAVRRARACRTFWRRWHISLSTWFRDYLYVPLGGNRVPPARRYANLVTVFFLCGLWHGASWTFVVWGLWHGAFLVVERVVADLADRRPRGTGAPPPEGVAAWPIWRTCYTLAVVMVGWVFFRADTLPGAIAFLKAMAGLSAAAPTPFTVGGISHPSVAGARRRRDWIDAVAFRRSPAGVTERDGAAGGCVATSSREQRRCSSCCSSPSIMQMAARTYNPFIYFRF